MNLLRVFFETAYRTGQAAPALDRALQDTFGKGYFKRDRHEVGLILVGDTPCVGYATASVREIFDFARDFTAAKRARPTMMTAHQFDAAFLADVTVAARTVAPDRRHFLTLASLAFQGDALKTIHNYAGIAFAIGGLARENDLVFACNPGVVSRFAVY